MSLSTIRLAFGIGLALGAASAGAQQPVPSASSARASADKVAMCIGCHGIPGYKTAYPEVYRVPLIGGQQAAYIVNALKAYKSGERSHPSMRGIAASLSEQDMAELAAYYAGERK